MTFDDAMKVVLILLFVIASIGFLGVAGFILYLASACVKILSENSIRINGANKK